MESIVEYYKLCSVVPKTEQLLPLVNHVERNIIDIIFTKKHVRGFLNERDGEYRLREAVIGAKDDNTVCGKAIITVIE